MRRSLTLHEFKERMEQGEMFDPETDASERVAVRELRNTTDSGGEGRVPGDAEMEGDGGFDDEEAVVSAWIDDYLE